MKAITFLLKTEQPVLATSFQGDPNSDVSYPYIPGSMIRGALISRYLKSPGKQGIDIVADETSRRLFFDGTTRYLNAYINSQEGQRSLPTLLCWRKEKGKELKDIKDKIDVYDLSVSKDNDLQSPKSLSEPFWIEDGKNIRLYSVDRRINIHNLRDRRKGRSASDKLDPQTRLIEERDGEIFRYDAIDTGQTFQGVILYDKVDEKTIQDLLNISDIWLGGSRSAGYGHVKISDVKINDGWSEMKTTPEKRTSDNIIKITLLSDLILRDNCGQYTAIPPTHLLADILGKQSQELETSLNEYKTYMDSVFVGGFNRKWGLPLPQVLAVKAGSVFVYEGIEITSKQICQLETTGIGERTVEGFGRVAVNWSTDNSQFVARKPEPKKYTQRNQPQLIESHNLARKMAERILRKKLEEFLLERVEDFKLNPNRMTNSQLSRLIIVAKQSLDINCRQPLDRLLDNLPSNVRTQKYERTKITGQSLNQKIKDWLESPKTWIDGHLESVAIANEAATLTDELALEYTLRLIMAIAKNATKEKPDD
ncbi:MAG TPA: RAMP superfamily protein [Cyanobacteria bacterium UBA11149]|nr:RAMP superfamily protein [Cyanobacteria bacterium UBA11367]HBE58554.1 RAMP superfamily protein [Cyanobacteria bacterium UBA11366]HBK64775.1 RAMP superfamily protein [Cyanobacteria bacterium UBA11166]HBR76510.1 RAMP superfamily protein [Cyanobacteria bacterium UBA11159]HBS67880.1 RAMP superfamily protein [Cyanobacteria bacterium UBA11153]HBW90081.1 RAMP superfamily protein [Cyanobacteria bacterium UBA11149]HCA93731.1 RAMP superfamily protein [Cyanobacteria bacterium UBA9226]